MYIENEIYREDLMTALHSTVNYRKLFHKSILVTGATGLIGSFLVDLFMYANRQENAGIQIYALARNEKTLCTRFASVREMPELHFVVQDVTEPLQLKERMDYIIHAAGDGFPSAFREYPVETMTPAVLGTWQLLQYAKEAEIERLLYLSSGEVYGKSVGKVQAFTETETGNIDSMDVRSCYPIAKRCAETLCVSFTEQYRISTAIARLSHTYGANVSARDNRATVQFMKNAIAGQDIVLHSPGKQLRSYTYVADCVSGLLTVLLNGTSGEAYNVANAVSRVTVADFARIVAEKSGRQCVFEQPSDSEKKELTPIEYAVLASDKLEGLGWSSKYDISVGVSRMLEIAEKISSDNTEVFLI